MLASVRLPAAAAMLFLLIGGPALAQSAAESAKRWGLIGTWAVDCGQPPGRDNVYSIFRERNGALVHERDLGEGRDLNPVENATIASDGSIVLAARFPAFDQVREFVFARGGDERIRVLSNRRAASNDYSIRDGKFVHDGQPSQWQSRCR